MGAARERRGRAVVRLPLLRQVPRNRAGDHALPGLEALERTAQQAEQACEAARDDQLAVGAPAPTPLPEPRAGAVGARMRQPEDRHRPFGAADREVAEPVVPTDVLAAAFQRQALMTGQRA